MDEMEEKLGAILGNPELMAQIMQMAQSLNPGGSTQPPREEEPPSREEPPAGIDFSLLGQISRLASETNLDSQQRTLLKALGPYLRSERIHKLERAMQAARMAHLASALLGGRPVL